MRPGSRNDPSRTLAVMPLSGVTRVRPGTWTTAS